MTNESREMDRRWEVPEFFNIGAACTDEHLNDSTAERVAMIVEDDATGTATATFRQLAQMTSRFAQLLRNLDVATGERILIRLPNSLAYPTAFLGTMKRGAIAVPTSTLLVSEEVAYLAKDSGASVLVTHKAMWPDLFQQLDDVESLKHIILTGDGEIPEAGGHLQLHDFERELNQLEHAEPSHRTRADDPAYLVYTSGTTGHPKGVLHAHRAMLGRTPARSHWFDFQEGDRIMHSGKFNWTYVLGSGLMDPLYNGKTVIVHEGKNDAGLWPRLIAKHQCTIFIGVPTIYRQVIQKTEFSYRDVPSLRHCMSAGEHLSDEMLGAWRGRFGMDVYEAIGMSELSYYISQSVFRPIRPGSAGFPQPGHEVALLDEDQNEVPDGEEGMICIPRNDPGLFLRYWNLPEETDKVFSRGWFQTGDYARRDEDGYIWFLGRRDDIINTFGYRVSPHEVERVMKTHPVVADCVAIGQDIGPEKTLVAACVILYPGATVTEEELLSFGEEHLAGYKRPKLLHLMRDYPRTKNGKVIRSRLKKQIETGQTEGSDIKDRERVQSSRIRPRRTLLYVSADLDRHLEKSSSLPTDALVYDLHESISPQFKERGRNKLEAFLQQAEFQGQELIIRVNPLDSPWVEDDLGFVCRQPIDAVLFTEIDSAEEVRLARERLDQAGGVHLPMMVMIETPLAVLNAKEIATASDRLSCMVVSNANLMTRMRLPPSSDRTGLFASLAMVVLAARAADISVVDGSHLDLTDSRACEYACRQSRDFGFDGKAAIHPAQLAYTNDAFSPKPKDVVKKREIIRLMEEAMAAGRSYAVMENRLLQPSELILARRCVALHEAIRQRNEAYGQENAVYVEAVSR